MMLLVLWKKQVCMFLSAGVSCGRSCRSSLAKKCLALIEIESIVSFTVTNNHAFCNDKFVSYLGRGCRLCSCLSCLTYCHQVRICCVCEGTHLIINECCRNCTCYRCLMLQHILEVRKQILHINFECPLSVRFWTRMNGYRIWGSQRWLRYFTNRTE
jgi:hypothetical protein